MGLPSKPFRIGSVLWALLLGVGAVAFLGSIMLPSTKRSRISVEEMQRRREELVAAEAAAAQAAATQVSTTAAIESPDTSPAPVDVDTAVPATQP